MHMQPGASSKLAPADPCCAASCPAGHDQAYGGAVVFSSPPEGTAEAGSYGDGKPVGVRDGAWGDEFSGGSWPGSWLLELPAPAPVAAFCCSTCA